jgi:hypothetical protein
MRTSWKILAAGAVAGAAAYAWRWHRNYRDVITEDRIRAEIPGDMVEGFKIPIDEVAEFDAIVGSICLSQCCYTPLNQDEIDAYGFTGDNDSGTPWLFRGY